MYAIQRGAQHQYGERAFGLSWAGGGGATFGAANGLLDLDTDPNVANRLENGLRAAGAISRVGLDPEAFAIDAKLRPMPFPVSPRSATTTRPSNMAAPGPTAGAGLPGLAFASMGLFRWWRRRRPTAGYVARAFLHALRDNTQRL